MKVLAALNFIILVGSFIVPIDAEGEVSLSITVPNSPSLEDESDYTIVYDKQHGFKKIPLKKAHTPFMTPLLLPVPFFNIEEDIRFELFTPKNPTEPQLLTLNDYASVKESNFNWLYPTRLIIHGWYSEGVLTPLFRNAYFNQSSHKVNFIAVNWQKGSDVYNYMTARNRVQSVAEHVANFVDFMSKKAWLRIESLTIVGHSLGAHVAGIAGKRITGGKVNKIVGLDPAAPLFNYDDINGRLAETDASYVEVIHTCAGTLGISKPIGMASFYPNGGKSQPGCSRWDVIGICAHQRAYEYYVESIIRPEFYASQCDSFENVSKGNCSVVNETVQMGGEPGNKKINGIFYLETNNEKIFAKGKKGIVEDTSSKLSRIWKLGKGTTGLFKKYW